MTAAGGLGRRPSSLCVAFSILVIAGSAAFAQPPRVPVDVTTTRLDAAIRRATDNDVPLLAPKRFDSFRPLYQQIERRLQEGGSAEDVAPLVKSALEELGAAEKVANAARSTFRDPLSLRDAVRSLGAAAAKRLEAADALLRDAAARAEAGEPEAASRIGAQATAEYGRAASIYLREVPLANVRRQLEAGRQGAREMLVARAFEELNAVETLLEAPIPTAQALADVNNRIGIIPKIIFPEFYLTPPKILKMGGFTLYVESYEAKTWDFQQQAITGASGFAWMSFECAQQPDLPFPNTAVLWRNFRVVQKVADATAEIGLGDAQVIKPGAALGSTIDLGIPAYAKNAKQISQALLDLIANKLKPKGDIRLRFDGLTIYPTADPNVGVVFFSGTAVYPTEPAKPDLIQLPVAGFRLLISKLTISPVGGVAEATLEFPPTIIDPGRGHPGRVPLSALDITPDCRCRRELPNQTFGPWSVGNTEMLVEGKGITVDLDPTWIPPGAAAGSDPADASWRGVLLGAGKTKAAVEPVISNSGYLRAAYTFDRAEVTSPGLKAHFALSSSFTFGALQPAGYQVRISKGSVDIKDSAVYRATFENDRIVAPLASAKTDTGAPVPAHYLSLNVDAQLDLRGRIEVSKPVQWGEYTQVKDHPTYFEAREFPIGFFYLSGKYRRSFYPLDTNGEFNDPSILFLNVGTGPQGISLFFPKRFKIFTPDTPADKPLEFWSSGKTDRPTADWINLAFDGVHGRLQNFVTRKGAARDLGPIEEPFYKANTPFKPYEIPSGDVEVPYFPYTLRIVFVSSAAFDSDMDGRLYLPMPVASALAFDKMIFTSTAMIAGAQIPFNDPFKLSYWGLDMVKEPGAASAGVISVRSGQVFFTAAGLQETRHFGMPFYLVWGEMRADGVLGRFVFDYNSAGQSFDRFPYTPAFVRLSDYKPGNEAYLKTAGTLHFDFFGPKYANLHDVYDPSKPNVPYNSRRIELAFDTDPGGLFGPTDTHLTRDWSGGFGSTDFTYSYDDNAQDGFLGKGKMGFLWIGGLLNASAVIKAERICMTVNESARHDFALGPFGIGHFGGMEKISGCGCIVNGQLERVMLSAELEAQEDMSLIVRSAGYGTVEWSLTPSVSQLMISGDMYVTLVTGSNLQVTGNATFTVDRSKNFVEGQVDGRIDSATGLGGLSVSAEGQLDWHIGGLGEDAYQSLQGRLAVNIINVAMGSGAEGGFYAGMNAPKSEAWVLAGVGPKFHLNMNLLPDHLTGVYGHVRAKQAFTAWVVSGGIEAFVGLGGFVLLPDNASLLGASSLTSPSWTGLPYVLGHVGVHIWGDIAGGFVSASGWADTQLKLPHPFSFEGTLGLEGCVLWVACKSVEVECGLNKDDGLYIK